MTEGKPPRDVAVSLQESAEHWRELDEFGLANGNLMGIGYAVLVALGNPCVTVAGAIELLADFVDRPECRMELVDITDSAWGDVRCWRCSRCGDDCEEVDGRYERCPHCGAVVREERR